MTQHTHSTCASLISSWHPGTWPLVLSVLRIDCGDDVVHTEHLLASWGSGSWYLLGRCLFAWCLLCFVWPIKGSTMLRAAHRFTQTSPAFSLMIQLRVHPCNTTALNLSHECNYMLSLMNSSRKSRDVGMALWTCNTSTAGFIKNIFSKILISVFKSRKNGLPLGAPGSYVT